MADEAASSANYVYKVIRSHINMANMTFRGGCLCGAIRYEISGEPQRFYHCHCTRCRKATGTGHATNLFIKADHFQWLQGEAQLSSFKVPEAARFTNTFCRTCGGRVPRYIAEIGSAFVPAGSLDHDIDISPQARIFWGSRAAWSCSNDGLPIFDAYPQ
jgi:hypothetical protein